MRHRASRGRDEELLLAGVSEAAGRGRLGRRRATYPGTARTRRPCLRRARRGASAATRLDLYDHGLTVAAGGLIHVVRYDTASVRRSSAHGLVLTDIDGAEVTLHESAYRQPESWLPEVRRSVGRPRP